MNKSESRDRDRGVLSPADRKFIDASERERRENYSRPAASERRQEIHQRSANSILDYPRIIEYVNAERVLEDVDQGLIKGLQAQVMFVYQVAKAARLDPDQVIWEAVDKAKGTRVERLLEKYETDPESLTIGEVQTLAESGEISRDERNKLVHGMIDSLDGLGGFFGTVELDEE